MFHKTMFFALTVLFAVTLGSSAFGLQTESAQVDRRTPVQTSVQDTLPVGFEGFSAEATITRPDRAEIDLANGVKLPYATLPDREFLVQGSLRLRGDWKLPKGKVFGQEMTLRLVLVAKPIFNVRDPDVLAKIQKNQSFNWSERRVDASNDDAEQKKGQEAESAASDAVEDKHSNPAAAPGNDDQKIEVVASFSLPKKEGVVDITIPFDSLWKPKNDWKPDYYYSISIARPENVKTIRAGVFQVTRPQVNFERNSRVLGFRILRAFGFDPDPFTWLK